ncbi:MAG: hypothetical protein QHJ34_10770 [bacterium]|jgi:hypothetical protein|nr:hypothetical protein [candidate division KSB1 bacterium]MDH7560696.1 hypothetical protein [bacterium]
MRYGEIAVATPKDLDAERLVRAVCADVHHASSTLHFGRLPVSDNLTLHVYGIQIPSDPENYRWELLLPRVLGIVVAYQWRERSSLEQAQRLLDFFRAGWQVPILVAADAGNGAPPVPSRFCAGGIRLSAATRFLFFQSHDVASVRAVYTTLLDLLLDRVPDL